ncbi:MAG: transglutaminase family protein [Candidatus Hydrogenedentota bacterium]
MMLQYPDPETCLARSQFIDSDAPEIVEVVQRLTTADQTPAEKAVILFNYVRDNVEYEFTIRNTPNEFKASFTLGDGRGFCVRKSLLVAALCRAAGIPSVIILCNMKDMSISPRVVEMLGTDIMYNHGLAGVHLEGHWYQLDASLSPELVAKRQFRLVEFDGQSDALQENTTMTGDPHMEYVAYHGAYIDLPYKQMMQGFDKGYANANKEELAKMGWHSTFDI